MSVKCELCGKEFKNTQGLRGHKTFVHKMPGSSSKSPTPLANEQLSKLEERLQRVERITGFREPGTLDWILGTDKPVTEQLEQHTRKLAELSIQLEKLSQQVRLAASGTEVLNIKEQLTQLTEQVGRHDRWLTTSPVMLFLGHNSRDCPAFLIALDRLRKQVNDHQGVVNWVRKKFSLVKQGTA